MKSLEQIRADNARPGFTRDKSAPLRPSEELVKLVTDLAVTVAELAERCRKLEDFQRIVERRGCGFFALARVVAEPVARKKGPRPRRKK